MTPGPINDGLFERRLVYPDIDYKERFDRLIGLDEQKMRLSKMLALLINPAGLDDWANKFTGGICYLVQTVARRPPLVILSGDVGSGKTELAETVGDSVSRQEKIGVTLLPLSLSARGQGRVGEMTQLISSAFEYTASEATKLRDRGKKARGGVILLVDEADALAQSREAAQMHHEDRAGVNAFIRGIDRLSNSGLPAAVIMCTNRIDALDPAVRRRAAEILLFERPNAQLRKRILERAFDGFKFSNSRILDLVNATGARDGIEYGFTFSDLTQRLLPAIVLDAYPSEPIKAERAVEIALELKPTAPFVART